MTFTNDELILILISLVRDTRPAMLKQEADGFSVDFESLTKKNNLDDDDRLLIKLRTVLEPPPADQVSPSAADPMPEVDAYSELPLSLELSFVESRRLAGTLAHLEGLQPWPADVLAMSRNLRTRLLANKPLNDKL
jgi:hypothetical protein